MRSSTANTRAARSPGWRPSIELSANAREGIFIALAEKLKKDDWTPPPGWWRAANNESRWRELPPEEKLGAWIMATDADYIELAETLLGRKITDDIPDRQPPDGSRIQRIREDLERYGLPEWLRKRDDNGSR